MNHTVTTMIHRQLPRLTLLASALGMLAGCAINTNPTPLPGPLRAPLVQTEQDETLQAGSAEPDARQGLAQRFNRTPSQRQQVRVVEPDGQPLGQGLKGDAVSLNVNNFPLPAFINEVFGKQLGLSFTLSPELQKKSDLVTLRMSEPQPPAALFNTARNVLADYGVEVKLRDGLYNFSIRDTVSNDAVSLMVSGRALPDVPLSHRPVFQSVPLRVVNATSMNGWLRSLFEGTELTFTPDYVFGTMMLSGPVELVKRGMAAIALFDQPALKSSHSISVTPAFTDVDELGTALVKVLQSEGYDVSTAPPSGAVQVIVLKELQRIVIFAADNSVLNHIQEWILILDKESQKKIENGLFIYQVKNTQAAAIATMLGALGYSATVPASGIDSSNTRSAGDSGLAKGFGNSASGTQRAAASATSSATTSGSGEAGAVVVDANRNALIFKGSGKEWIKLRPLLDQLDKAVPSVMIDVLLAEVTLNDKEGLGVDWKNIRTDLGARDLVMGTANGLGSSGLNMALNSAGQTRATLNAFYDNKQAVIRSSPKLMVRSGEEARIEVGNEIPVVTGTSQASDNPDAPINKTVQYRKTGVILSIKPTVQASGVVDLLVSQELSEQADTSSSSEALSPTIMNRKVETALTLRDGGSVMLAGLISSSKGEGDTGVPLLGDIPWLGNFFKSKSKSENRTELVVMIIPYVMRDFSEAQSLTERYQQQLQLNNAPTLKRRFLPGMAPEKPTENLELRQ
ncbi:type II secretion system protein GspD [Aeromonas veronii]